MDIVQSDDRVIKSSERNMPATTGRLVKLDQGVITPVMDDA